MKDKIDCYWVWETKNDKNLAERLEERVKFKMKQEFVWKLNSLKGEIMALQQHHEEPKRVVIERVESLINDVLGDTTNGK